MTDENEIVNEKKKKVTPAELAALCAEIADSRKAEDIAQICLEGLTIIADYFVVCTGNTAPHIRAITDYICREVLKQTGIKPRSVDGEPASKWTVIDFCTVIVHVLSPDMRDLYRLESLWGDAPSADALKTLAAKSAENERES